MEQQQQVQHAQHPQQCSGGGLAPGLAPPPPPPALAQLHRRGGAHVCDAICDLEAACGGGSGGKAGCCGSCGGGAAPAVTHVTQVVRSSLILSPPEVYQECVRHGESPGCSHASKL